MEQMTAELRQLLERQVEIREAMRKPGGIRVTVERELFAIGEKLKRHHAMDAIPASEPPPMLRRQ